MTLETFTNGLLVISGVLTGLLAGVFYAFNVAVVPALRAMPGRQHIAAMQLINQRIQNPVFFLSFFGPTFLLPLVAFLYRGEAVFLPLVGAALLHIFGSNGVTLTGNIPLNLQLDRHDWHALSESEADKIRAEFQGQGTPWMRYHNVRTWAAIGAAVLVLVACLSKK